MTKAKKETNVQQPLSINLMLATLVGSDHFEFSGITYSHGLKTFVDTQTAEKLEVLQNEAGAALFEIEPF